VTSKASDAQKDQVLKNKNLIWDALGRNHLFDGNQQLKELVMSVVGSIIFNAQGRSPSSRRWLITVTLSVY
jgi:conjugative transfer pilus assembly protein TraH